MKKNVLFALILMLFLLPNGIKAYQYCDYQDKTRLQKLASNISTGYTYVEEISDKVNNNSVKFTVTLSNLHNDIKIVDAETGEVYLNNLSNEIKLDNIQPGSYLKYYVYGNISNCLEERIATIYITLPTFNKYYTDELCRNIPEYSLCNKWANVNMTYDQFKKNVQYRLNDLIIKPEIVTVVNKESTLEKIINFLAKYSLIIFGSIIIICASLIYYLSRKDDFDLNIK